MLERLIEGWLDRINERGYQAAYCTALSAQGFTILHNTRHSPIEFGKDIIARAPDGRVHLFQLKGNPGGRLTGNEFRALIPQLDALVAMAWDASAPPNQEVPFLVTNGLVEEEARQSLDQFNARHISLGRQALQIIDRGQLLSLFVTQLQSFFPTDPDRLRRMLELLAVPGDQSLEERELQEFLLEMCDASGASDAVLARSSYAAAILAELIAANAVAAGNHFESIKCRVTCIASILSWHHAATRELSAEMNGLVGLLRAQVFEDIDSLEIDYIIERRRLSDNYFADNVLIDWRREVLAVLFAASLVEHRVRTRAAVASNLDPNEVESRSDFCRLLLETGKFWGERSHFAHIIAYLGLSAGSGNGDADLKLLRMLMGFQTLHDRRAGSVFPNIYYSYERVFRSLIFPDLRRPDDPWPDDNFWRRSRLLQAIFLLACRKNWKHHAKQIWPVFVAFTHVGATRTELSRVALPEDETLEEQERIYPDAISWFDCLTDAEEHESGDVVAFFRFDIALATIWLLFFPHRIETNFLLTADRVVQDSMNLENPEFGRSQAIERIRSFI